MTVLLLATTLLTGCPFDKPEIEDRWTRIDVAGSNVSPNQSFSTGTTSPITVSADVTYRSILTGFAVAELRGSSSLGPADVDIDPEADRVRMAGDIDRLLQSSVPLGRATRAITGWDHLVQRIDFTFSGYVPGTLDSTGAPRGLFLVCYLGSGEEIELADGSDSVVVTPFNSTQYELLPVGMELRLAGSP